MRRMPLRKGFGVFFDPNKTTSGQRFFGDLCQALAAESLPLEQRPTVVLFNVSAPWQLILKTKLNRQKIVLRVDGLYFDRLCPAFLAGFKWPLRPILALGLRFVWTHDFFATVANLCNQNYGAFFRILFADWLIYQSEFSHKVHQRYFPGKPFTVIVNGSVWKTSGQVLATQRTTKAVRLVTIYDEWKPAKRMIDIVSFVKWANENKSVAIQLAIIGYTGRLPTGSPSGIKEIIETAPYIQTFPRFKGFSSELSKVFFESDLYLSLSYRDPCPNVVIEAMAHGLPVVGIGSGGMPDIVRQAGILTPANDFANGYFSAHRWEYAFPAIDFDAILEAIGTVIDNYEYFKAQVQDRFLNQLGIDVVAEKYACLLRQLVANTNSETQRLDR